MDIGNQSFRNLRSEFFNEQKVIGNEFLMKKTHIYSPVFTNIFRNFKVIVNKKFKGLSSLSVNDEEDQYICKPEDDSQMDVFTDEEDDLFNEIANDAEVVNQSDGQQDSGRNIERITVIIKVNSILINGLEFGLNSSIRSSCVIGGSEVDGNEEDSILLSLASGYLLLIRLYYVPKDTTDYNFDLEFNSEKLTFPTKGFLFKPFIVQWWNCLDGQTTPSLNTTGYKVLSHINGRAVVTMSASNVLRFYPTQTTDTGLQFLPHINVPVEGLLLHGCFAEPSNDTLDSHFVFLLMIFTDNRRLELNLFVWVNLFDERRDLTKTTLPLNNEFTIPIHIVALKGNDSFLFICEKEIILITVHDICSVNYNFKRIPYHGSFPTSFYKPKKRIYEFKGEISDEIIISTANGVFYSIIVSQEKDITIYPIIKINDSVSLFSIEKRADQLSLLYGCATGNNRELKVEKLYLAEAYNDFIEEKKLDFSNCSVLKDYRNWSPILDVKVVNSIPTKRLVERSDQELWILSGVGKKAKLGQLKKGFRASRFGKTYDKLKDFESMYAFNLQDSHFLMCNSSTESVFLQILEEDEEKVVEIEDSKFNLSDRTLFVGVIDEATGLILQVTKRGIIITDNNTVFVTSHALQKVVLKGDFTDGTLSLLFEDVENRQISLEVYRLNFEVIYKAISFEELIEEEKSCMLCYEPSNLKFVKLNNSLFIALGDYESKVHLYNIYQDLDELVLKLKEICDLHEEGPINFHPFVPTSMTYFEGLNELFIGTNDGYYINIVLNEGMKPSCRQIFRIGTTELQIGTMKSDERLLLYLLSKRIWLFEIGSQNPVPIEFNEKYERAIYSTACVSDHKINESFSLAFIREDGLTLGKVDFSAQVPINRSLGVGEVKKFIYVSDIHAFLLFGSSQKANHRIKLVDKNSLRILPHREVKLRNSEGEEDAAMFQLDEMPLCATLWSIKGSKGSLQKILIGCSFKNLGSLKIIDLVKNREKSGHSSISLIELTTFKHFRPIISIQQVNGNILFASEKSIHSTSYNAQERRLRPISSLVTLASDIVSLNLRQNNLLVTTKLDSIICFKVSCEQGDSEVRLELYSKDPFPRSIVNQEILADYSVASDKLHSAILLMESRNKLLNLKHSYKLPFISRVFIASFSPPWYADDSLRRQFILCIGVNGQISGLGLTTDTTPEFKQFCEDISSGKTKASSWESLQEILRRPFVDKVTGKGLRALYKPFFDYAENQSSVLDFDLPELSYTKDLIIL